MTQGNMSGAGPMSDTLDFVKKLWGGMSVPGMPAMVAPTLSVEELEQKITDLKTVESWLNVNMTMLHNTIQAMEVQRATLGTLQSMSAAFQSAVSSTEDKFDAAAFWSSLQPAIASPAAPKAKVAEPEPASTPEPKATVSAPEDLAAQMASPTAWWNILQNQFKQAVSNAITEPKPDDATAAATTPATSKASAATRKPAAESTPASVSAATKSSAAAPRRKPTPKA